jgi:hypothetical protein
MKTFLKKIPIIKHMLSSEEHLDNLQIHSASIQGTLRQLQQHMAEDYLQRNLFQNEKYQTAKKLNVHERQIFSQNGEDGILCEIFKRIGTQTKFFVEFGAANGLENNTTALLLENWQGLWMEGGQQLVKTAHEKFRCFVESGKLKIQNEFIHAENIESLFKKNGVPADLDLLSIDIDGNDYWVWKAITNYSPRVVCIEYNAAFGPSLPWIMEYNAQHIWRGSRYQGASLKSLETLALEKGYHLVGCDFLGVNAFFVRKDLAGKHFLEPFDSETHFESPKYFLQRTLGHPRDFGNYRKSS